jgi:uncharacterized protein YbbK (DUF523 family)
MNLREVQLSSRSVIPVALALPINREPVDIQRQTESMRRRRESSDPGQDVGAVSFYL